MKLLLAIILCAVFTVAFAQCPPTALPFVDNFDGPTLDPCWYWVRGGEPVGDWNTTAHPGWLQVNGPRPPGQEPVLVRDVADLDMMIETKMLATAGNPELTIWLGNADFINASWAPSIHNVRAHNYVNGSPSYVDFPVVADSLYLRYVKTGTQYGVYCSTDGSQWSHITTWDRDMTVNGNITVGVGAVGNSCEWDYFRITRAPTQVCGNVSGVWTAANSPYVVNCDVTVPAGQMLTIDPGVQVLFTGHYKFYVLGNLQAIGTEQDSIVFTRAFPTEESKWWGIRFQSSQDTSRISYCRIEYGNATLNGNAAEDQGGAIRAESSRLAIENSIFYNNHANAGGGAIFLESAQFARVQSCEFDANSTNDSNAGAGAGAIEVHNTPAIIRYCLFASNSTATIGGAVVVDNYNHASVPCRLDNCTFSQNTCMPNFAGSALVAWYAGQVDILNCIFWDNLIQPLWSTNSGSISVSYSDVQGGHSGISNINADPLFVDAPNGDFHLRSESPCMDAGDPNSPLDPDGSRADMGAFPFSHLGVRVLFPNGGENWTLFEEDTIRWIGTGFAGGVTIELNRDYPNGTWELLAENTDNDGGEAVTLNEPISTHCRVRVSSVEDVYTDVSDGDFAIVPSQGYLALTRQSLPANPVLNWNVGALECPQTATEVFRFKNFGSAPIIVYRADNVSNPAFSRITDCALSYTLAPGEMSACGVTLSFAPPTNGTFNDTLRVHTNASNGVNGYLRVPLSGTQISTPATPQVVITTQGPDAHLWWQPIAQSVGGCAVTITNYLVFYAGDANGPYWYHGWTPNTTYTHYGVVPNAGAMFYRLYAVSAPGGVVSSIPLGMKEEEVLHKLTD